MNNYQKTKITYRSSFWGAVALAFAVAALGGLPAWVSLPISVICLVVSALLFCYAAGTAYRGDRDCAAFAGGIAAISALLSAPWSLDLFGRLAGNSTAAPWWLSLLQIAAGALVLVLVYGNGDDPVTPLVESSQTKVPPSGRWFDADLMSIVVAAAIFSGLAAGSALANFGLTAERLKTFL
jgi:hypothetical protein